MSARSILPCWWMLPFTQWFSFRYLISIWSDKIWFFNTLCSLLFFSCLPPKTAIKKKEKRFIALRREHPRSRLLSLTVLFIQLKRCVHWYLCCKTVRGPSSASHQHNDIISTKLSACHWLIIIPTWQMPSTWWRSNRQNLVRPMMTAVHGPMSMAISACS